MTVANSGQVVRIIFHAIEKSSAFDGNTKMKSLTQITFATTVVFAAASSLVAQDDATGSPLEDITQEMKVATNHLSKKTTDKQTQKPQEDAVSKLDLLIKELEKERQGLGSGVNPNATIPANSSTIRTGPGGMGDLHGAREQGNRWGDLPAHERDRILQSLTEGFPPHYQAILEAYYKRLAVEKRAEDNELPTKEPKANSKPATPQMTQPAPAKQRTPAKKAVN